nr:MAG TPA: hypothetical protein [Caudoviricetes sp.]
MTKRYLKTPEEVVQALKEGKTVETDIMYYVLKDGLLNCYVKNKTGSLWSVNPAIYDTERPYVEEPKQLKLEVGKFYKTRDGRKAFVYAKIGIDCPYPFCVVKDGKLDAYNVSAEGKKGNDEQTLDLVAPWEEH